jgi:hypothetical protein
MSFTGKEINIITQSEDYLRFIAEDNLNILSEQFSSVWKCNGITTKEINNWLVGKNINSKIDFVQLTMETWEKNYCTFFKYGRIISNNNNWYYIDNSHSLARNNILNLSLLDKGYGYQSSNLITKIKKLQQENVMLKKKIKELQ